MKRGSGRDTKTHKNHNTTIMQHAAMGRETVGEGEQETVGALGKGRLQQDLGQQCVWLCCFCVLCC